ncbi:MULTISPECIES: hypothetical protein [unclassified Deinococcus]|uniref:hypothetical protein n=1 Tax=unclassified Deinococcus TaxID=2623546 RepID=UPI000C19C833|nr:MULTISPECIES: hypothetical protein [unclassified Deinococcus]MCD0168127.1 hypothetical protein [Deinococcus sp. 23YEL01]PIG95570.1 hypothetical protein AMD26_020225 [Deinococcus sp. UR1]
MKRAWIVVVAALVGLGGWWVLTERRWQSPLFCIERPGTLWNGLAPLPAGFTPECPTYSRSYREEIRAGLSRVEMYRVAGWQPQALLPLFRTAGYRQLTDDPIAPGNYAAFLGRGGAELQYLATREDQTTLITISGKP